MYKYTLHVHMDTDDDAVVKYMGKEYCFYGDDLEFTFSANTIAECKAHVGLITVPEGYKMSKYLAEGLHEFTLSGDDVLHYELSGNQDILLAIEEYIPPPAKIPYLLCAAIHVDDGIAHGHQPKNIKTGFVVCGHRHHNCFTTMGAMGKRAARDYSGKYTSGFLTSCNRYVDRIEGMAMAIKAGQGGCDGEMQLGKPLFSEDLYMENGYCTKLKKEMTQ